MAAVNFPNSPSVNDTHTSSGSTWKWDGGVWQRLGVAGPQGSQGVQGAQGHQGRQGSVGIASLTIATSPPGSPDAGDMWWDSDDGDLHLYYNDGNSSQWANINNGPAGAQGAVGAQGAQGHQGVQGATGSGGAAGAQGAQGHQGVQGAANATTINNNANNKVITGSGSANTLEAEASLTFDAGLLKIDDTGGTAGKGRLEFGNSGEQFIEGFDTGNAGSGSYLRFGEGSTERLRIDSSGRLLVGTSSARTNLRNHNGNGTTPEFQFETANVDNANDLSLIFGRNNSYGAEIILAKHRSATVGGTTVVQSGDRLGGITFSGSDGTNFIPAAYIQSRVGGTPGTNDMPGTIELYTTADGAATPTERLRILSNGNVLIKNSTTSSSGSHEGNVPLCIDGGTNKITLMLGDSSTSVSGHGVNDYSGALRYNGANIAWGDIAYYPNGDGAGGSFRFTRNGSTISSTPNARIGTSGIFLGGTADAQLLDDYEEGQWTPNLMDGNSSNISFSNGSNCYYTKIGRLVYCYFNVTKAESGSKTGIISFYDLPFTSHNTTLQVTGTWWMDHGQNSGDDAVGGAMYVQSNSKRALFVYSTTEWQPISSSYRYVEFSQWNNGRPIYGSFTYMAQA